MKYSKGCHIILVSFKVCYIEIDLLFESTDFCGGRETKQLLNEKRVDTKEQVCFLTLLVFTCVEVLKYSNVVVSLNGHCRMSEYLFILI